IHDLEAHGRPFDTACQIFNRDFAARHGRAELEDDLRLKPRCDHPVRSHPSMSCLSKMDRLGVDMGPDRFTHLEPLPHAAVGTPDLATNGCEALGDEPFMERAPNLVRTLRGEVDAELGQVRCGPYRLTRLPEFFDQPLVCVFAFHARASWVISWFCACLVC